MNGTVMKRMGWWLVNVISRMLEPDEREVVLGDFAESGEAPSQVLCGVVGLVVRRQAKLWAGWRPWVALVGLILPLGMLLSIVSRSTAEGSAVYLWLYANNWDWALTTNPGFWRVLAESVVLLFVWWLTLACWSWTAGFVLGSASRGMVQINGVLLCVMLLFGELVGAPLFLSYREDLLQRTFHLPALPDYNAAVFDLAFYRTMFPLIVQAGLVAIPALWGLRQGSGAVRFRLPFRVALWIIAAVTLAAMAIQEPGFWIFLSPQFLNAFFHSGIWLGWGKRLLNFAVFWPVAYLVADAVKRRWQGRTVAV